MPPCYHGNKLNTKNKQRRGTEWCKNGEDGTQLTSQLWPVKPAIQAQVYFSVSGGLSSVLRDEDSEMQEPLLRQGCPSQGSGGGVAREGINEEDRAGVGGEVRQHPALSNSRANARSSMLAGAKHSKAAALLIPSLPSFSSSPHSLFSPSSSLSRV